MTLDRLATALAQTPTIRDDALALRLSHIITSRAGESSRGYPFLPDDAHAAFRDHIPHVLESGPRVLAAVDQVEGAALALATPEEQVFVRRCGRVVRTMLNTAAITAPPDLWLLRHVLGTLAKVGLTSRLLAGEVVDTDTCAAQRGGESEPVDPAALRADLTFLRSRGLLVESDDGFSVSETAGGREVLAAATPVPEDEPAGVSLAWERLFRGAILEPHEVRALERLGEIPPAVDVQSDRGWVPTFHEIRVGYRLVPLVVGLRAAELTTTLAKADRLTLADLGTAYAGAARGALSILEAAGVVETDGDAWRPTPIGRRVLERGPGPFGIIETYHAYMERLDSILFDGREAVWVKRGANIAASQDANRRTFRQLTDALDRFSASTGFTYDVFIEHALGRGEATRQRFERSGDETIRYFGADLEDAAIDAAEAERAAGRLPRNMVFVRQADIGEPASLLARIRASGARSHGAVMTVGNGFHEVRNQTDEKMIRVFRAYAEAGIVLLFTEANAFSVRDLLSTAWNTYHAGFMYVHEKSGQGLRPARPIAEAHRGRRLRASWTRCGAAAGYVRAEAFCARSRTAYPTTPEGVHNPAISVNHVFVPEQLAKQLGISPD